MAVRTPVVDDPEAHAAFLAEVETVRKDLMAAANRATQAYFSREPSRESMLAWLTARDWREMEYVLLIGTVIQKYYGELEQKHLISLGKQLWDETKHYESLGRIVKRLGGRVPTSVSEADAEWSRILWSAVEKDRSCCPAAWYISESSAAATIGPIVQNAGRYGYPDVAEAYAEIERDEAFHVKLGKLILERYTTTEASRQHALAAVRAIAQTMKRGYLLLYPSQPAQ